MTTRQKERGRSFYFWFFSTCYIPAESCAYGVNEVITTVADLQQNGPKGKREKKKTESLLSCSHIFKPPLPENSHPKREREWGSHLKTLWGLLSVVYATLYISGRKRSGTQELKPQALASNAQQKASQVNIGRRTLSLLNFEPLLTTHARHTSSPRREKNILRLKKLIGHLIFSNKIIIFRNSNCCKKVN